LADSCSRPAVLFSPVQNHRACSSSYVYLRPADSHGVPG
jgi:hypothetical protein